MIIDIVTYGLTIMGWNKSSMIKYGQKYGNYSTSILGSFFIPIEIKSQQVGLYFQ